jgi:prophage antirepressor-like protein
MSDIVTKGPSFHSTRFDIVDANGERWVTVKQLAEALGYGRPDELRRLINRRTQEFSGKVSHVNLTSIKGERSQQIINYHGMIRAAMLSDAPRAKEFRDWAETVLFTVMTTGSYLPSASTSVMQEIKRMVLEDIRAEIKQFAADVLMPTENSPTLTKILDQFNESILIQGRMMNNLATEMHDFKMQAMVVAQRNNSHDPTPTERIKQLVPRWRIPKHFNTAGSFDLYCNERHAYERGGFLPQRDRRNVGKLADHTIELCPENDQFLRDCFERYLKNRFKQTSLKLLPAKTTEQPEKSDKKGN